MKTVLASVIMGLFAVTAVAQTTPTKKEDAKPAVKAEAKKEEAKKPEAKKEEAKKPEAKK